MRTMDEPFHPIDVLINSSDMRHQMELACLTLQKDLCDSLTQFEPSKKFQVDRWLRKEGGGGISCVLQEGETFEKAGVNVSVISGALSDAASSQMKQRGHMFSQKDCLNVDAIGISCVIHPNNPYVPTFHFNFRYFQISGSEGDQKENLPGNAEDKNWWFGGGVDLTPYYLDHEDGVHFHRELKNACDKHSNEYYPQFKKQCDDYFYIKHREECRGIGGIFFDDMNEPDQQTVFSFIKDCMSYIIPCYIPIVMRNHLREFTENQREWQAIRRGRYVEFNLMYDRGTRFGMLQPGSRIESILVSLPVNASWKYMHETKSGSEEEKLMKIFKKPIEWI